MNNEAPAVNPELFRKAASVIETINDSLPPNIQLKSAKTEIGTTLKGEVCLELTATISMIIFPEDGPSHQ
ncbi:MAG: hypothetical protein P9M15_01745 [Candidatus Electryoneaceae bacterium]|nr:hypothetical protein [Candidatus Electryoneaceae bacterium]